MHTGSRGWGRFLVFLCSATLVSAAGAAEPTREQAEFFEKKVRPLLADNCFGCHSEAKGKKKGGLVADSRAGLLKGGDTGPALVPGAPEKSLLVKAISYTDADLR